MDPKKAFVSRYCHLLESFLSLSRHRIALDINNDEKATHHCSMCTIIDLIMKLSAQTFSQIPHAVVVL